MNFNVYIVECSDGTLYTGVTNNLDKRLQDHNSSKLGAKYTKLRRPVKLVYFKSIGSRSLAQKQEYLIKKLTRIQKLELIKNFKA